VKKHRTLYEGPEWDASRRKIDPNLPRFEEAFRWAAYNIATEPLINSTAFLDDDHRVMVFPIPGVADLWIYFRIEPGDNSCTLLWVHSRGEQITFRVG
jgi:hypothetical protein